MMRIPRHFFLDRAFDEWAYQDTAFPIDCEQTISQPYTVAYQTELLDVQPRMKVLEIGTGSGYQACVLAELGCRVFTIERHEGLHKLTTELLREMGYGQIRTYFGDGYKGLPRQAPFDRILVTAGATEVPQALLDQLAVGGKLVIPVGTGQVQKMLSISRLEDGSLKRVEHDDFRFVPFLKGTSRD
jgi:protein-L-isoaspartate(D-aspartate) O-methyltransferase